MSGKQARKNRKSRTPAARPTSSPRTRIQQWKKPLGGLAGVLTLVAVIVGFALPDSKKGPPAGAVKSGVAPAFFEREVMSGRRISSASLRGKNVLLFFSEGVMCQACFEQIQSLEARAEQLRARHFTLVNITTDPSEVLRQAVEQYAIDTPMISDEDGDMSTVYGAIGQGMHANTDGHTFVLLDRSGRIRWRRDYTTMFVPPDKLLAAIPKVS